MKDEKDKDSDLDPQTLADQLEERLIDFAVRIIKVSNRLPKTPARKHISGQILRCGTSPAPNYGEARGAESRADFVHKMRIVFKELNETSIWLRIIEIVDCSRQFCLQNLFQKIKSSAEFLPSH